MPKYDPVTGENCDESINGVNFENGIIDDERFGMRRFVYHDNNNSVNGDPDKASEYYLLLQGIWKNNEKMHYKINFLISFSFASGFKSKMRSLIFS